MLPTPDPTERFTDRAADYAAARPGYPPQIAAALIDAFGLARQAVVADIGSGTGLSCEPFLRAGLAVIGVEPNQAMRAEGDRHLAGFERFRSVAGTAEATGLPNAGVPKWGQTRYSPLPSRQRRLSTQANSELILSDPVFLMVLLIWSILKEVAMRVASMLWCVPSFSNGLCSGIPATANAHAIRMY